MAIPVINEVPKYSLVIPSTKKKVTYRPFLVKEQKILLMALESNDRESIVRSISDTVEACVMEPIEVHNLATFDLEYMFTQIRSKSVGEHSDIILKCTECDAQNEVSINLEKIQVNVPDKAPIIQLNDKFSLKLRYPRYDDILPAGRNEEVKISELYSAMALASLDYLLTENEQIRFDEESEEERIKFLDNLNTEQFQKILRFVQSLPKLTHKVEFDCQKCEHHNSIVLEGLENFF